MCGKIGKGIRARLPKRANSVPKLLADIGPPRSEAKTCGDASCSRCKRRRARISALAPADVQTAGIQLDLMPLQIAQLGRPKPVPVGDQDHGGVPVTVSTMLACGLDQPLDLAAGEIPSLAD